MCGRGDATGGLERGGALRRQGPRGAAAAARRVPARGAARARRRARRVRWHACVRPCGCGARLRARAAAGRGSQTTFDGVTQAEASALGTRLPPHALHEAEPLAATWPAGQGLHWPVPSGAVPAAQTAGGGRPGVEGGVAVVRASGRAARRRMACWASGGGGGACVGQPAAKRGAGGPGFAASGRRSAPPRRRHLSLTTSSGGRGRAARGGRSLHFFWLAEGTMFAWQTVHTLDQGVVSRRRLAEGPAFFRGPRFQRHARQSLPHLGGWPFGRVVVSGLASPAATPVAAAAPAASSTATATAAMWEVHARVLLRTAGAAIWEGGARTQEPRWERCTRFFCHVALLLCVLVLRCLPHVHAPVGYKGMFNEAPLEEAEVAAGVTVVLRVQAGLKASL